MRIPSKAPSIINHSKAMSVISDSKRSIRSVRSYKSHTSIRSKASRRNLQSHHGVIEDAHNEDEEENNAPSLNIKDDS